MNKKKRERNIVSYNHSIVLDSIRVVLKYSKMTKIIYKYRKKKSLSITNRQRYSLS